MKNLKRLTLTAAACAAALALPGLTAAAPLFSEDFEVDPTSSWTVNNGPSDEAHNFFFDYSTVGIPVAPNSAAGGTRGMKLQANQSSGVFGGMSVSPTGRNFTGDYRVRFDWWANFNGPFPAGGSGSNQLSTFGIGTSGTMAQWPGGTKDSIFFAGTGDGNSSSDWRAYSPVGGAQYADTAPGIYAAEAVAGSTNASHAYYAGFGSNTASAAQLSLYPQQSGTTQVGSAGMEWHQVKIEKVGSKVTWTVDGTVIATVPAADDTVITGNNIFFGHSDVNATSSTDPNDSALLFTLIDNIRVEIAPLYSEDFELNPTSNWTVNNGPSDEAHNFFFDYSTVGIPPSPNSASGDTHGMKLQANQANGIFSGMSVSPIGQSFTGDYWVQFDWWANFNGPFPAGGSGSNQLSTFGIGTSGTVAQWPGGTKDSIFFAGTGDGNSSSDWRAYSPVGGGHYGDTAPGIYAAEAVAGSTNASHAYYAGFGSNTASAAQLNLYPQQTGATQVGSAGMEWHRVKIEKIGSKVTWTVDGVLIATVPAADDTVITGNNIFFGHSDVNATSSTDPNDSALLFTLIDNIRVEIDTDGDRMPDSYERENGLDPATDDADGDLDGDGAMNYDEFFAGTDPQDAASKLQIVLIYRDESSAVIDFTSVAGKQYRLQAAKDLSTDPIEWTTLPGTVLGSPTNGIIGFKEEDAGDFEDRFYRVFVLPSL